MILTSLVLLAAMQNGQLASPPPRNPAIVYKCKDSASGATVFSAQPCASDPTQVVTVDTSAALRTGSGGAQAEIAASVDLSNCRYVANANTLGASDERVRGMLTQRTHLSHSLGRAGNGLAAATFASGVRGQIASVDASIAQDRLSAQAAYLDALKQCEDDAKERVKASSNSPIGAKASPR